MPVRVVQGKRGVTSLCGGHLSPYAWDWGCPRRRRHLTLKPGMSPANRNDFGTLLLPHTSGGQTQLILPKPPKACCPFAEVGVALPSPCLNSCRHLPSPKVGCQLAVPRSTSLSGLQQETDGVPRGFLGGSVMKGLSVKMRAGSGEPGRDGEAPAV